METFEERVHRLAKGRARLRLARAHVDEAVHADHTDIKEVEEHTSAAVKLLGQGMAILQQEEGDK